MLVVEADAGATEMATTLPLSAVCVPSGTTLAAWPTEIDGISSTDTDVVTS